MQKTNLRKEKKWQLSSAQFAFILLIPAFAIFGLIQVFPLGQALFYSFTDQSLLKSDVHWVGLENYKKILTDRIFWEIFYNTIVICFTAVIFQLILGLVLALLLNQPIIKGRNFLRGMILIVWVIPFIVVTVLWAWLFNADYGLINYLLKKSNIIQEFIPWTASLGYAKITIIVPLIWRRIPFVMIMLLAGLQSIPIELSEAAKIDGAGAFSRFHYIILPQLKQLIGIIFFLSLVQMFQIFVVPYLMTGGGPLYNTTTFSLRVWKLAFTYFNGGEAAATGGIWLLFLCGFSILLLPILNEKERKKLK